MDTTNARRKCHSKYCDFDVLPWFLLKFYRGQVPNRCWRILRNDVKLVVMTSRFLHLLIGNTAVIQRRHASSFPRLVASTNGTRQSTGNSCIFIFLFSKVTSHQTSWNSGDSSWFKHRGMFETEPCVNMVYTTVNICYHQRSFLWGFSRFLPRKWTWAQHGTNQDTGQGNWSSTPSFSLS